MSFARQKISRIPPHRRVLADLRHYLGNSRAGGYKLPSTPMLAEQFGVSIPTLRKALARLVEDGVLEVRKGSGYFVAGDNPDQSTVGILFDLDLPTLPDSASGSSFLLECQSAMRAFGHRTRVYLGRKANGDPSTRLDSQDILDDLRAGMLQGVIDVSGRPSEELTTITQEQGIPLLGLGKYYEAGVDFNLEGFIRKALTVVTSRGCRKIAFMAAQYLHPGETSDCETVIRVMHELGLPVNESWIRTEWHTSYQGAGWDTFRQIWFSSDKDKPDALILGSAAFGWDLQLALRDTQLRYPHDIMIVSAADKGLSPTYTPPPWPRVEANQARLMSILAEMMHECLSGKEPIPRKQYVDVWEINDPDYDSTQNKTLLEDNPEHTAKDVIPIN